MKKKLCVLLAALAASVFAFGPGAVVGHAQTVYIADRNNDPINACGNIEDPSHAGYASTTETLAAWNGTPFIVNTRLETWAYETTNFAGTNHDCHRMYRLLMFTSQSNNPNAQYERVVLHYWVCGALQSTVPTNGQWANTNYISVQTGWIDYGTQDDFIPGSHECGPQADDTNGGTNKLNVQNGGSIMYGGNWYVDPSTLCADSRFACSYVNF